jgi:hypothetical protein
MNTLVHADIFFFITTIAVVIGTIILCVISWYIIGIVRDARYVARRLRHATDELEADFEALRRTVTEEGSKAKHIINFFLGKFLGKSRTSHKKQAPSDK